jgi:ammonium transporter Rh
VIQALVYSLNQILNEQKIGIYDAGGSTTIHTFGAYFGLGISWVLSKKVRPQNRVEVSYNSNIFAMIGTLFLWVYWPSFNFGVAAHNNFEQTTIVANTLYALTGSCLATFIFSALLGRKLSMSDILNATLAGGVAVGAASGITYYPFFGLAIGLIAGAVSTLGFHYLTPFLERKIRLHDTCGIHNLHGIPGVLGGIFSAIILASYQNGTNPIYTKLYEQGPFNNPNIDFLYQGGLQFTGTIVSLLFGLIFGVATGFVLVSGYK